MFVILFLKNEKKVELRNIIEIYLQDDTLVFMSEKQNFTIEFNEVRHIGCYKMRG